MKKKIFVIILFFASLSYPVWASSLSAGAGWRPDTPTVVSARLSYDLKGTAPFKVTADFGIGKDSFECTAALSYSLLRKATIKKRIVRCYPGLSAGLVISKNRYYTVPLCVFFDVVYTSLFSSDRFGISFLTSPFAGIRVNAGKWSGAGMYFGCTFAFMFEFGIGGRI